MRIMKIVAVAILTAAFASTALAQTAHERPTIGPAGDMPARVVAGTDITVQPLDRAKTELVFSSLGYRIPATVAELEDLATTPASVAMPLSVVVPFGGKEVWIYSPATVGTAMILAEDSVGQLTWIGGFGTTQAGRLVIQPTQRPTAWVVIFSDKAGRFAVARYATVTGPLPPFLIRGRFFIEDLGGGDYLLITVVINSKGIAQCDAIPFRR